MTFFYLMTITCLQLIKLTIISQNNLIPNSYSSFNDCSPKRLLKFGLLKSGAQQGYSGVTSQVFFILKQK